MKEKWKSVKKRISPMIISVTRCEKSSSLWWKKRWTIWAYWDSNQVIAPQISNRKCHKEHKRKTYQVKYDMMIAEKQTISGMWIRARLKIQFFWLDWNWKYAYFLGLNMLKLRFTDWRGIWFDFGRIYVERKLVP